MSISSYAELQTAVGNWLKRSDLTSIIPDLITLGEKRINRKVRAPEMETAYTGTIASGAISVPSDFLAWKFVYIDAAPIRILEVRPLDWLFQNYPTRSADSEPAFIARNGSNFEFGPYPDSGYSVAGTYYKRMAAVSSSWHALATASPDLYLMAALCEAAPYIKDDNRILIWEEKFKDIVADINKEAKGAEVSSGAIRMSAR